MKVKYRLSIDLDHKSKFQRAGLDLDAFRDGMTDYTDSVIVYIEETDPRWPDIKRLSDRLKLLPLIETEFSLEEERSAACLRFMSTTFFGFPEPRLAYREMLEQVYDLSNYCTECGLGKVQKEPIRLAKDPKWGRGKTFQTHWLFDVILVEASGWENIFKPFGVEIWPVHSKSSKVYSNVVQLRFGEEVTLAMTPDAPKHICKKCRRPKYHPLDRGFFPRVISEQVPPLFWSKEEYGYERAADRWMLVRQDLYMKMRESSLNCRFWPCESEGTSAATG